MRKDNKLSATPSASQKNWHLEWDGQPEATPAEDEARAQSEARRLDPRWQLKPLEQLRVPEHVHRNLGTKTKNKHAPRCLHAVENS